MQSYLQPAKQSWWHSRLPTRALTGSEAVRYGRGLLLATGLLVSAAMPLLHPSRRDITVLLAVSAAMSGILGLSLFLPWQRWSDRATLVFPAAVMIALASLGSSPARRSASVSPACSCSASPTSASASAGTPRSGCCRSRCRRTS